MGRCVIGEKDGVTFIQCYRGETKKPQFKVKIKDGTEFFVSCSKEEFNRYEDTRSIFCTRVSDLYATKYMRSYLKWVGE